MATFYLLPARGCLEVALADFLAPLLPGLPLPPDAWDVVADRLASVAGWPGDVFLVPRDDLPADEHVSESLASGYGAEPGDRVIESGATGLRVWVIPGEGEPADDSVTYFPGVAGAPATLRLIR